MVDIKIFNNKKDMKIEFIKNILNNELKNILFSNHSNMLMDRINKHTRDRFLDKTLVKLLVNSNKYIIIKKIKKNGKR